MKITDFDLWEITDFTPAEVIETGANLSDVNLFTIVKLQAFRSHKYVNRSVLLLHNGLTTGKHSSYQHENGTAVDITFRDLEKPIKCKQLIYAAVEVGFKGIGLYFNGAAISMHLDLGPDVRRWLWVKPHRSDVFTKMDLIVDPFYLQEKGVIQWPE